MTIQAPANASLASLKTSEVTLSKASSDHSNLSRNSSTSDCEEATQAKADQLKELCKSFNFKRVPERPEKILEMDKKFGSLSFPKGSFAGRRYLSNMAGEEIPWKLLQKGNKRFWKPKKKDGCILGSGSYKVTSVGFDLDRMKPVAFVTTELTPRHARKKKKEILAESQIAQKLSDHLGKEDRYYLQEFCPGHKRNSDGIRTRVERHEIIMPIGKDVCDMALEGSIRKQDKMKMFQDMANDIEGLHDLGYAHCDIKPENFLFMKESNETMVIDFGQSGGKESFLAPGTPIYFPIENLKPPIPQRHRSLSQNLKNTIVDCIIPEKKPAIQPFGDLPKAQKGDVWSLGMTCFAILQESFHPFQVKLEELGFPKTTPSRASLNQGFIDAAVKIDKMIDKEKGSTKKNMLKLIKLMTLEDPDMRPTMAEVKNYLNDLGSVPYSKTNNKTRTGSMPGCFGFV